MSEQSLPEPSATPPMPSFLAWAGPMLGLWVLAVVLYLYHRVGGTIPFVDPETLLEPNTTSWDRATSAVQRSLFAMPIISAIYITIFFSGVSYHYKFTVIGKFSNVISCFVISKIFEHYFSIVVFIASGIILFSVTPFFQPLVRVDSSFSVLVQLPAVSVGAFLMASLAWLIHRIAFGQGRGSTGDWFKAHVLGFLGGVGLLILAVGAVAMAPEPKTIHIATAGVLLLPLPHLMLCYRVSRRHCVAERVLVEDMKYPNRFVIAAGFLTVATTIALIYTHGRWPLIPVIEFLF